MFDAVGHGMRACQLANLAVAAYRNCRRSRLRPDRDARLRSTPRSRSSSARAGSSPRSSAELDIERGSLRFSGRPPVADAAAGRQGRGDARVARRVCRSVSVVRRRPCPRCSSNPTTRSSATPTASPKRGASTATSSVRNGSPTTSPGRPPTSSRRPRRSGGWCCACTSTTPRRCTTTRRCCSSTGASRPDGADGRSNR